MIKGYIITFHTHHDALVCLRHLEQSAEVHHGAIAVKLIPVPRELSSACGTAVKVTIQDALTFNTGCFKNIERDEIFTFDTDETYDRIKNTVQ